MSFALFVRSDSRLSRHTDCPTLAAILEELPDIHFLSDRQALYSVEHDSRQRYMEINFGLNLERGDDVPTDNEALDSDAVNIVGLQVPWMYLHDDDLKAYFDIAKTIALRLHWRIYNPQMRESIDPLDL